MRTLTSVDIDDDLMRRAMRTGNGRTRHAVVEAGLRLLVQIHAQTGIRRLRGKIRLDGNLKKSR